MWKGRRSYWCITKRPVVVLGAFSPNDIFWNYKTTLISNQVYCKIVKFVRKKNRRTAAGRFISKLLLRFIGSNKSCMLSQHCHCLPDCLHGFLPAPFLLSYSVFDCIFPYFFRFWAVH